MKHLRFWVAALITWLILFFNIERFFGSGLNLILTDTYIFVALVVLGTFLLPKMHLGTFSLLLTSAIVLFLVFWVKHPIWRKPLAFEVSQVIGITMLTLIQLGTIVLSGLLARQISNAAREFERVIGLLSFNYVGLPPKAFATEQGVMYRELKRARRYHRPLSVVALQLDQQAMKQALPKMVQEVQQGMMQEFVMAGVARVLDRELNDFNLIALHNDCFVVVLPELKSEESLPIAQRLGRAVQEEVGARLRVGMANYPDDAETFESLIERAIESTNRPKSFEKEPDPTRLEVSSTI